MKKTRMLILGMTMVLLLTACGGGAATNSASGGSSAAVSESWSSDKAADAGYYAPAPAPESPAESAGPILSGAENEAISNTSQLANVKLIHRASVSVETLDFDEAAQRLSETVNRLGGYFENSYVWQGGYYSNGNNRNGNYVIRVPSAQYEVFLSELSADGMFHVTQMNRSVEDIGEAYYDTEARLTTQRIKLERLQELLKRAELMEDIITIESEISNVEFEIENLSSTLNRYDGLVDYATIELNVQQVGRLSDIAEEKESFGEQLLRGLKSGARNFVDGLGDFAVWCAYNLIGIVVFVIVVAAAATVAVKAVRRRKAKRHPVIREEDQE